MDTKIEIKLAFWNRPKVLTRVRYGIYGTGLVLVLLALGMYLLVELSKQYATIEASAIFQIKEDWGSKPYSEIFVA